MKAVTLSEGVCLKAIFKLAVLFVLSLPLKYYHVAFPPCCGEAMISGELKTVEKQQCGMLGRTEGKMRKNNMKQNKEVAQEGSQEPMLKRDE